ncbi:MAG: helix-turn-helix transcriptional regulator [Saprospiraceae bacterium]|nr:helix-turn-helix transcriptional regulator [Saprospiraceae bacterium]
MSSPPNYLRVYRKRSGLVQEDIAYLLNLPDYSNISRYEKGLRSPTTELLLTYHHLFDVPIESFYEQESESIRFTLIQRIKDLIQELKKENQITLKNTLRIKFLEQVIIRLTNIKP